jgi:hypothetical protein
MSKDYHEQTDQFEMDLENLITKYTEGDADSPDAKVLNSPLEPRLNHQTMAGCMHKVATLLLMENAVMISDDDDFAGEEDNPVPP